MDYGLCHKFHLSVCVWFPSCLPLIYYFLDSFVLISSILVVSILSTHGNRFWHVDIALTTKSTSIFLQNYTLSKYLGTQHTMTMESTVVDILAIYMSKHYCLSQEIQLHGNNPFPVHKHRLSSLTYTQGHSQSYWPQNLSLLPCSSSH